MTNSILHSACTIRENKITLNGEAIFESDLTKTFSEFAKEAYHYFDLNYPKFFKMDNLSKLGMLSIEGILLTQGVRNIINSDKCALILSNHSSSIESDKIHAKSISNLVNFFPMDELNSAAAAAGGG